MANITITVQSLFNAADYDSYTIDNGQTINQLKTVINNAIGTDSAWYDIVKNETVLSGTSTLSSLGITSGTQLRTNNKIDSLATRELRQNAKLALAAKKRSISNKRFDYDIDKLPTKYSGNTIVDNPNVGGLNEGRPWLPISPVTSTGMTLNLVAGTYSGSGNTWYDLTVGNADVTLINNPTYTSGTPAYFTFNAASSQSATGTTENVIPSVQYTKGVWFYINSYADNNLVSSEAGGHYMFMAGENRIYAGNSHIVPYVGGFGSLSIINLNTWYYAVVTYHYAHGIKLYINGLLDAEDLSYNNAVNNTNHTGNGTVNIGRFGAGNFLNGRIGEVHCYGRELMDVEVLQNFNATRARYGV